MTIFLVCSTIIMVVGIITGGVIVTNRDDNKLKLAEANIEFLSKETRELDRTLLHDELTTIEGKLEKRIEAYARNRLKGIRG